MKSVVLLCLIAAAVAAPPASSSDAVVLRYDNNNIGIDSYAYGFEQSDGTKGEAKGELKDANSENAYYAVRGSFEWVGADGVTYSVVYTADENGYRPVYTQGQGGAIPAEVIKSFS